MSEQHRPLPDPPPVPVRDELAERLTRRRAVVHGLAPALGEAFEPSDQRVAGEAAARDREVGRDRAVARAEAAHTVRAETRRRVARAFDELFELRPRRGSLAHELV